MFGKIVHLLKNVIFKSVSVFSLLVECFRDYRRYVAYSATFKTFMNSERLIEGRLTAHYHGIEKGLAMKHFRPYFGKKHIEAIDYYLTKLKKLKKKGKFSSTHVNASLSCLKSYVDKHDYERSEYIENVSTILKKHLDNFGVSIEKLHSSTTSYDCSRFDGDNDFRSLAHRRKSVRVFDDKVISKNILENVVKLALTSPSVCNRQSTKLVYLNNEKLIGQLLDIQGGANGFKDQIKNLVVVFSDLEVFEGIQERNQPYIDSGIFAMNLLYSLEYHSLSTCPLMWPSTAKNNERLYSLLDIRKTWEPIVAIAIGYKPNEVVKMPISKRVDISECLEFR
ncbi:hypothetical protein HGP28_11600 [Vibrio sp. SM6]|uniref:Nitroreductase domain-containing protein n=1 Tax=Vibrio agarilyticus TaxID=2726741 RepID=A0A7X8TRK9_9VIBR|nr:nitroreductase family protein [Vibrio agarilyticus]NLS13536.1 hypothetical protein [Vibrio agarilyticus]